MFLTFFQQSPLLFYALQVVIGIESALQKEPLLALLSALLSLPFLISRLWLRPLCGALLVAGAYLLTNLSFTLDSLPEEGIEGIAWIAIEQLSYQQTGHTMSWVYKGKIRHFWGEAELHGVPFFLAWRGNNKERPSADREYLVQGVVKAGHGKRVIIKPSSRMSWEPIERSSWAESRFQAKQKVKKWIESHYSSSSVASFLAGLVIGEFDDVQLKRDFGRFGLLHLLAISGFHFSILASLLGYILRPLCTPKTLSLGLIFLLSSYFFFLGWGPSVLRAWMTIMLFYGACLTERLSRPLNSLGFALLISTLLDPLLLENLGFQFSLVTTAAILICQKPVLASIQKVFFVRSFHTVTAWPFYAQGGYLILGFFSQSLALTVATSLVAVPISLCYFGFFPLLSLVYNLFFPLLVSFSMTFLLLGFLLSPLPWIGSGLHRFNDYLTSWILNMTYDIPASWDLVLPLELSTLAALLWIITVFISTIYFQKSANELKLTQPFNN